MTVAEFIAVLQAKPELLDRPLAHTVTDGSFPSADEVRDIYLERGMVVVSGGGVPSHLSPTDHITR